MKIKKTKSHAKTAISCIISLICVVGIVYSLIHIAIWYDENNQTREIAGSAEDAANIAEVDDDDSTEYVNQDDNKKSGLYWKFANMKLIDVDFNDLLQQNPDTVAWLQVGGTNINYPVVQTSNNEYYLNHSFERKTSTAGWVFADFRNTLDGHDRNLIMYAHGRYDETMFGTLKNALTNGWLNNEDNFYIRTATPKTSGIWQVFSIYTIPTTNDYIQTNFSSDKKFGEFVKMLKNRSRHDFKTDVSEKDQILTLSTCFSSKERIVVHAKLIKRNSK